MQIYIENLRDFQLIIVHEVWAGIQNGPGLNMSCPIKNGHIPASYVTLPEGYEFVKN